MLPPKMPPLKPGEMPPVMLGQIPHLKPGQKPGESPEFNIPFADVSFVKRKWLDIQYASFSPSQKLDVYLPEEGDGPFPVILNIHGGGFAIGDKRDIHLLSFLQGINHGYAVVSVNYRLSGESTFPAAIHDIKAAIRWIKANGKDFHLNGQKIAACGGSAGGNLSLMACLTANNKELVDDSLGYSEYSCDVQLGVDMFGPTDFLKMDEQVKASGIGFPDHDLPNSPESRYLGSPIQTVREKAAMSNPITYIHSGMPPLLIQHGNNDHLVPVEQSLIFVEAIKKRGYQDLFELDILENADHGDPMFDTEQNMNRVFAFLDKYLK